MWTSNHDDPKHNEHNVIEWYVLSIRVQNKGDVCQQITKILNKCPDDQQNNFDNMLSSLAIHFGSSHKWDHTDYCKGFCFRCHYICRTRQILKRLGNLIIHRYNNHRYYCWARKFGALQKLGLIHYTRSFPMPFTMSVS